MANVTASKILNEIAEILAISIAKTLSEKSCKNEQKVLDFECESSEAIARREQLEYKNEKDCN